MALIPSYKFVTDIGTMRSQWAGLAVASVILYAAVRCVYLAYFHPLAKYPGPRIAAVSNIWWAYHWLTGRYPWAIARALDEYGECYVQAEASKISIDELFAGDIVRIGPNEVVFIRPKASEDIYDTHTKHLEHFTRTDWLDLGEGEDGIIWERDPVRHRQVRKSLSPAFSVKSLQAKEPTLHKHIDYFLERMRELGDQENGVDLREWTDWLTLDISADMAYSREMKQMQTMKNAPLLDALWAVNFFLAVNAVTKKFRLLAPLKFLFVPPSLLATLPNTLALNHKEVLTRINLRGNTTHLDYFEHLCPPDAPEPDKKKLKHMEIVAGQLLSAGYEPISSQFLCTLMFLIQDPTSYRRLAKEIRGRFGSTHDIDTESVAHLRFLNACLMETLRITVIGANGLPRISPGAVVDGHYIEKGINVQYGHFAFTRSPRYFRDPESFKPQRWLRHDHEHWDDAFADDAREAFWPFSRGPRSCPGMGSAWRQTRLFIAKVLCNFDVELVPGEGVVFDRDFRSYAMWDKPKIRVRFRPVARTYSTAWVSSEP